MFLSVIVIIFSIFSFFSLSWADETKTEETKLGEIVVTGARIVTPTKEAAETVYTGIELTREGIKLGGERASHNVWEALSILPGVMFLSPDPANLASTQMGIRIRGISGSLGSMAIEGIPIYGGNPIGPRTYVLDLENFESIAIYKGAVPSDLGPGAGTRGGAVQLRPLWARDSAHLEFKQAFGSFDYTKSFIRVDTGKISTLGTKVSLSYSYAEEDKWRGGGKVGPRNNVNFTLVQPAGEAIELKIFGNYNETKHHKFRALTYQQASNLDQYGRYDYSKNFTGVPSQDWQYYDFNKLNWTNYDIYGLLTFKITDNIKLTLKPYSREEEKEDWSGLDAITGHANQRLPGVQFSSWTVKRWGGIADMEFNLNNIKALIGYQYEESEWKDRPAENFWLNPDGSMRFIGWGRYTKSTSSSPRYSPYAKISGVLDKLNWQLGLKYLKLKESLNEGYLTKYDSAGNPYAERESKLDYGGKEYDAWLPTAGLSYPISENVEIYSSFGRTFQQPYAYMPLVTLYYDLYSKFAKMGITMKDLFKDYRPEKTDNIDIGLRIKTNLLELQPTLFYSKHMNLRTPITPGWKDPDNPNNLLLYRGNPVSYSTFVGKARGYGVELGSSIIASDYLTIFMNPTYIKITYDDDIVSAGTKYNTNGKQVVDVPEWSLVTGAILKYKGFEVAPILKFIGKRYGDLAHKEKIPSHAIVNLKLSYGIEKLQLLKDVKLSLDIYNLFDKKYIVSTDYFPGSPLTLIGTLSFAF